MELIEGDTGIPCYLSPSLCSREREGKIPSLSLSLLLSPSTLHPHGLTFSPSPLLFILTSIHMHPSTHHSHPHTLTPSLHTLILTHAHYTSLQFVHHVLNEVCDKQGACYEDYAKVLSLSEFTALRHSVADTVHSVARKAAKSKAEVGYRLGDGREREQSAMADFRLLLVLSNYQMRNVDCLKGCPSIDGF